MTTPQITPSQSSPEMSALKADLQDKKATLSSDDETELSHSIKKKKKATHQEQDESIKPPHKKHTPHEKQDESIKIPQSLPSDHPTTDGELINGRKNSIVDPEKRSEIAETDSDDPADRSIFGLVVKHYVIVFVFVFGGELFAVFLSGGLFLGGYDLFPVDFKDTPMNILSDKTFLRSFAYMQARQSKKIIPPLHKWINYEWRSDPMDHLEIVYQGSNVLTTSRLKTIDGLEKLLTNSADWHEWCLTDRRGKQLKPLSIIRFFDGSIERSLSDPNFSNVSEIIYSANSITNLKDTVDKLISRDAVISKLDVRSSLTRSIFSIGTRLAGEKEITNFWKRNFVNKLKQLLKTGKDGMNIYIYNSKLFTDDFNKQMNYDLLFAVASFVFIVSFIWLQTQSFFITSFGIFSIFASFLWTNLIYRIVLGYKYFGTFHALSIFIILGIGSDNLFVFFDLWRSTAYMDLRTTTDRFRYCYNHATLTMLITSTTTAVAFACNIVTPLYSISSFAVFTSLLVMINYLSAIVFFPLCILVYHKVILIDWAAKHL